jgi:hypothetical protein
MYHQLIDAMIQLLCIVSAGDKVAYRPLILAVPASQRFNILFMNKSLVPALIFVSVFARSAENFKTANDNGTSSDDTSHSSLSVSSLLGD